MSSINVCTFNGRLGGDAASRYTANEKHVMNFSLAVDVGWGDNKHTLWIVCNAWGDRWEKLVDHLVKGTSLVVTGDIDLRKWTGKEGIEKETLELNVRDLSFHGSKDDKPAQAQAGGFRKPPEQKTDAPKQQTLKTQPPVDDGFEEDDIPF